MRLLRPSLRIGVLLTLSLLCLVAAAFSLVESPVDGRGIGFGEAWRGGGDACLVTGEDDRRPPGCVELDPRGDDVGLELGNGCLLGGTPGGGWNPPGMDDPADAVLAKELSSASASSLPPNASSNESPPGTAPLLFPDMLAAGFCAAGTLGAAGALLPNASSKEKVGA